MIVRFLGQNCFLFSFQGKNILSDPFYNIQKEKSGFRVEAQKIDYVLVTHAHGDHIADVEEVLKHWPDAILIGQPEICGYFKHPHADDLNFGGTSTIGDLKITMVPALHTSSFPDGTYGGAPCGYIFRWDGHCLYLAGDTGVISEMAMFPILFGNIETAILPIGGHYTMDAEQAAYVASELLKTGKVIGCHFDTFPPITIDHQNTQEVFNKKKVELILPKIGQEINLL